MEVGKDELKQRTVWRKYLRHEREVDAFAPEKFAGVFCIREVSGYAVWYLRQLGEGPDGNYLLQFYTPDNKHLAIECAVHFARSELGSDEAIAALDADAKAGMVMLAIDEVAPPFETVQ